MKRKGRHQREEVLKELPPELRSFHVADWQRDGDPELFDAEKLPTCTQHRRRGCLLCYDDPEYRAVYPRMWSSTEMESRLFNGRYCPAVEGWALSHGLTVEEVWLLINGDGENLFD